MDFRLLGPVEVWADDRPIAVRGRRERTMLAVLLLAAGRLVPIEKLVDAVWGDQPPATARRQVHTGMSELRRILGDLLATREPGYVLTVDPETVDLHRFEALVAAARQAAAEQRWEDAAAGFREALLLWRGPALGGVSGLAGEAARLEDRRLTVLAERIDADLAIGRHADLVDELAGLVAEHSLRERFAAQLMLSLYRCGRQADALRVYQDARQTLTEGLGIDPGGELRRLEQAMLAGDPQLDLKPGRQAVPSLLPADVSDFTGRDTEIELLTGALGEPDGTAVRVVVLAGRGGVGKTALALYVAHRLDYPDGRLYVNLHGGHADPADVLGRFLRALGVDGSAIPAELDQCAELYRDRLAGRRVLVVLDDAGDESQLASLLPGTAGSAVLVTSRARLGGLAGATLVDLEELDHEQALRLLGRILGVVRVSEEQAAATELVELCGHLPLAVRIAGARLAARPHWLIADLVSRLRDERRRLDELSHGGLAVRASLELSFRGLDPDARRLFCRAGLLTAPDFADWTAAALLDTSVARARELADELVDARLLEAVGRDACGLLRFRFHDLVRGYARERAELDESPSTRQETLSRAFGAWLARAERAHRRIYGGDFIIVHGSALRWPAYVDSLYDEEPGDPLTWFETERLGIVAAIQQAAESGLDELTWDLALSCIALFSTRWYLDDWHTTYQQALAVTRRTGNRRGEAAISYGLAAWHDARGEFEKAVSRLESAQELFDGDRHGTGLVLSYLSHVARRLGRFEIALDSGERGRELLHEVGDRAGEAAAVHSLAQTNLALGRFETVESCLTDALEILAGTGNRRDQAQVLYSVGELHLGRGAPEPAMHAFEQVLDLVTGLRDRVGEAYARHGIGLCRLRLGRHADAGDDLDQALRLARRTGMRFVEARVLGDLGELHRHDDPERAVALTEESVALFRQLKAPLWEARALRSLGDIREAAGDPSGADEARSAAQSLFTALGTPD